MEIGVPIDSSECSTGVSSSDRARMGNDEQSMVEVSGTLCDDDAGQRPDDGVGEEDRMESDGGSEVPPFL